MGYWGKNLVRNFHQLGALAAVCDSDPSVEGSLRTRVWQCPFHVGFRIGPFEAQDIAAVALATPAVTHYELGQSGARSPARTSLSKSHSR